MKIPFNDLSAIHQSIRKNINTSISKVINANKFILSNEVKLFELEFAKYCNAKYAIGCGNGYDALFLALKSLNLKKNSEVIVPAMTYAATAYAVINAGLKIKLVDVDLNGLMNLEELERKISKKTKAVIPVHLYGQPLNMKKLIQLKKKYNFYIIEDCAQAHGAFDYSTNQKIGCIGDVACYSFYPGKNLGAFGDAGALVTNNRNLYSKLKAYRALGAEKKYLHKTFGINSRLDELQASILRIKIRKLDFWNCSRIQVANYYINKIKYNKNFIFINTKKGSVFHIFNVLVKNRKMFMNFLKKKNIDFVVHYPKSINQHNLFRKIIKKEYKVAQKIANNSISLPIFPYMKKIQIDYVVNNINKYIEKN
jgi:dTDP-4-amino-4,6-dideoxygalactose transaminase